MQVASAPVLRSHIGSSQHALEGFQNSVLDAKDANKFEGLGGALGGLRLGAPSSPLLLYT